MSDAPTGRSQPNAVTWHTQVASSFDARYATDRVFQERFALWERVISQSSVPGGRAIDIGCGSGQFLRLLAQQHALAVGVDGSSGMLEICREQMRAGGFGNVQLIEADLARLGELGLEPCDFAIASSVLEYLDDLDGALANVRSLLKPNGRFAFSLPNKSSIYRRLQPLTFRFFGRPVFAAHVRHMATATGIPAMLARHEFEVISIRYFAPTPVLSSLLRPLGLSRYSDNLLLIECAVGPAGGARTVNGGHR